MATTNISKVLTTVVDVGQGQCTFSILYDDSSTPKIAHTLLFDCGTDSPSPTTDGNIDWIAGQLALMETPTIDLLVFSHSDNDHISLMRQLLEVYAKKTTKKLNIPSTWYAGFEDFYTKHNFNILDYLSGYCKSFTRPDFNESQYDSSTHTWEKPPMWVSADKTVQVSMLMGNNIDNKPGIFKLTAFGTVAEKKNRVSIVCALIHNGRYLIICGDATSRTMAWTNYYFGADYIAKTLMLTLPHHGSRATGLNVSSGKAANANAIQVVQTFAKLARGKTLTVSAYAHHNHPSIELINYFTPYATPTKVIVEDTRLQDHSHFSVCNVDVSLQLPNKSAVTQTYQTLTSQSNVYATYYCGGAALFAYPFIAGTKSVTAPASFTAKSVPAVNPHACWIYATFAAGSNAMAGYTSMPNVSKSRFTTEAVIPETTTFGTMFHPAESEFATDGGRERPQHPSLLYPDDPPDVVPVVWLARAPSLATRVLAAASLPRLRTFR